MADAETVLNQTYGFLHNNFSMVNQTLENTKDKHPSLFQEPHAVRVIRLVFQTLMFLVGVLGNLLVSFVTSRKRGQTSTGNLLILHLAIADLGILLVDFPFVVIRSEFPYSWPFGKFICRTIYPFLDIFYGVQIGCITAIAFHRYKMLVHGTKPQITLDQAKKIVFLIWFISFVFIVAPLLFVMELDVKPWRQDCRPHWPNLISMQLFSVISALMFYVIPLTVILITYVKIRTLLNNNSKRHGYRSSSSRESSAARKQFKARTSQNRRAVQILTPVVVIFALTMLPFTIFRFVMAYDAQIVQSFRYIRVIFNICTVLLMVNSSVNPIIYSVVNSEFRRDFSNQLRCNADSCCSDTGENLTTVHRTSYPNNGIINRRGSAPLLGQQQQFLFQNGNLKENHFGGSSRSLDSALKDIESSSSQSNNQGALEPMKGVLLINVNPTYESGGF